MSTSYYYRFMPDSPKGREVQKVTGSPSAIISRGTAIESLGEQMQRAAVTLQLIADGQVGKGKSLDEIKDQADEVYADLKKAGERYAPSGTAILAYGTALDGVKELLNAAVDDCESLWETVQTRAGAVDDADDTPAGEDGSTSAREDAVSGAEGRLETAKGEWDEAAGRFDGHYDTWEAAYESAVTSLQDANEDGVSDGFWDDALPFFEALAKFADWAGLVLLVAALVIGGPLVAVLGTIVAVIGLIATVVLFAKGRKEGKDLAWAIVGVIPFSKFGKFAELGQGARFPKLAGFFKAAAGAEDFSALRTHMGEIDGLARTAWNAATDLRLYDQATSGSRLFQRIASGTPYVAENLRAGFTSDAFLGRLFDGDSWSALSRTEIASGAVQRIQDFYSTGDMLIGELTDDVDEKIDSWR
ncbi:hypothetical protein [Agromyces archimandritae]|uniref:WXG100 family type VII secretion target n=1 Tax=Agromyces archimandritae TaxID=2781962 RepID=A0A975FP88_9MICO|nr:hypothetical protein [Agromyces archimandritae]QTX05504.1 hypothetical protein G127AT_04615 [Agromyces archimandritae]